MGVCFRTFWFEKFWILIHFIYLIKFKFPAFWEYQLINEVLLFISLFYYLNS